MKKLGMPAERSYRKPVCSQGHDPSLMRREPEGWVCLGCFNEWLQHDSGLGVNEQSKGGVILPSGVDNPAPPDVIDVIPNRRQRRRFR